MSGHELAVALRLAYLTMHRRTNAEMLPLGVTADQFVVLAALAEAESLSQKELADKTACDRNSLRPMLVLLERQGLIERTAHVSDRRVWCICATLKGRQLFRRLWRCSESLRQQLHSKMSFEEVETLVRLLSRLTASVTQVQPASTADFRTARQSAGS